MRRTAPSSAGCTRTAATRTNPNPSPNPNPNPNPHPHPHPHSNPNPGPSPSPNSTRHTARSRRPPTRQSARTSRSRSPLQRWPRPSSRGQHWPIWPSEVTAGVCAPVFSDPCSKSVQRAAPQSAPSAGSCIQRLVPDHPVRVYCCCSEFRVCLLLLVSAVFCL